MTPPDLSLDLDEGDPELAEGIERKKESKVSSGKSGSSSNRSRGRSSGGSKGSGQRTDADLVSRLSAAFDRIAEQLDARQDSELASAIREDKEAMSRGIVSLTRAVKFLRGPLVILVNFVEPVLAFWRVGAILGRRFIERRERIMAERQMAAEQAQPHTQEFANASG